MAKTAVDLYCAMMGDKRKKYTLEAGVYPGDGVLDPRWEEGKTYYDPVARKQVPVPVDIEYALDDKGAPDMIDGKPVLARGHGTSLHDKPGWFKNTPDFKIPKNTEYSDELFIRKDKYEKTSAKTGVTAFHYQLEVRTRMTLATFRGYLDNLARAAVARQVELAKTGV